MICATLKGGVMNTKGYKAGVKDTILCLLDTINNILCELEEIENE